MAGWRCVFALWFARAVTTYLSIGVTLVFAPAALALIAIRSVAITVFVRAATTTAFATTAALRVCLMTRAPYTIATPWTITAVIGTGTMWAAF